MAKCLLLLVAVRVSLTFAEVTSPEDASEVTELLSLDSMNSYKAPSLTAISGKVTPGNDDDGRGRVSEDHLGDILQVLTDTWWKILVWCVMFAILLCLCCYISRCCYLCWDCCTDPFWGYCPRCNSMKSCLLLRCCSKGRMYTTSTYFEIDVQEKQCDQPEETLLIVSEDAAKSNGTVVKVLPKKGTKSRQEFEDCDRGGQEALPQVWNDGRYFNVFSCFSGEKEPQNSSSCSYNNNSAKSTTNQERERSLELISFSGKHANGSKVILEKSDVVIERGYEGRYQPLPEARSEWMPLIISSNKGRLSSNGFKRLSRSMESFSGVDAAARLKDGANEVTIKRHATKLTRSQVDVATETDSGSFSCNKYSQTDLNVEESSKERLDFRLRVPEPGAARSSNNNNEKCPLPKVKPKAVVAPPRTDQNVANGYPDLEKEILYGKETTILV